MTLIQFIILGIIQGITEFLPVSSTAHLILLPKILGWSDPGHEIDVFLNLGTLIVVLIFFFSDAMNLTRGGIDLILMRKTENRQQFEFFVISTIPAIFLFGVVEAVFGSQLKTPLYIGCFTVLGALLLWVTDRSKEKEKNKMFGYKDALIVGLFQLVSIFPGASRLGMCLCGMRWLGYSRMESFRYSILLSIPPVIGAILLKTIKIGGYISQIYIGHLLISSAVAFFVGIFSLSLVAFWISNSNRSFFPFVIYRLLLVVVMIIFA